MGGDVTDLVTDHASDFVIASSCGNELAGEIDVPSCEAVAVHLGGFNQEHPVPDGGGGQRRCQAISDGLHMAYQPVVSAATEKITGFEALLRWNHPARGAISPAQFIPIAEDAGLIAQIGEWVLRTACRDAVAWPESVRVAVNVSPIQFANADLPKIIANALATVTGRRWRSLPLVAPA